MSAPSSATGQRQVAKADRIVALVQLSWLALVLIRTAEIACHDTWRNISHELDRIQLHTYDTGAGTVWQRTRLTGKHSCIVEALDLSEPPSTTSSNPSTTNHKTFHTISVPSCCSHTRDGTSP